MNEKIVQEIQKVLYGQGENSMAIEVRSMWDKIKSQQKALEAVQTLGDAEWKRERARQELHDKRGL